MTQRAKLELEIDQPTQIELLYDEPITGKSKYGPYFLYAVKSFGSEFCYFADSNTHSILKTLKRGDKATITKSLQDDGNNVITEFHVELPVRPNTSSSPAKSEQITSPTIVNNLEEIMLSAYRTALKVEAEFPGRVDINKAALSIFIASSRSGNNGSY
jgi:hypothetical protein